MTTWVQAADESFQQIPISRMPEAYAGGLRVLGGYAGGGTSDKWETRARIDAWLSQGPDAGVAALFEIKGTEPIDSPSSGAAHARAARAAWRALGYPDSAAIFVAVDENVTLAEARAELTTYYRAWAANDTCLPVGYVEDDAGEILVAEGILAGVFTPAAYAWNNPAVLYTPANAPPHVVWTQEANGRSLYGADLDIGHIRITAPIWWAQSSNPGSGVIVPVLDQQDYDNIAAAVGRLRVDNAGPPPSDPTASVSLAVAIRASYFRDGYVANTGVPAVLAAEQTQAASEQGETNALVAIQQALAGLPAAVVAALPPVAGGQPGFTDAQKAQIEQAVADVLGHTTAALSVAPPAAGSGS